MEENYNRDLVKDIEKKQYIEEINGVNVLVKPIPDSDIVGAMDPRVYDDAMKTAAIMKDLPKDAFKLDSSIESINNLRTIFNNVDSSPIASNDLLIEEEMITMSDKEQVRVKIYRPKNLGKKATTLYYIHGGGFFAGRSEVVEESLKWIVEKAGYVIFSIDYRLAPENPYPRGHHDCYEGLQWVVENGEKYMADIDEIFVAGDSAGGNLAQYCTNRDVEDGHKYIKGQILLYPSLNMATIEDEYSTFDINKFDIYDEHRDFIMASINSLADSSGVLKEILQVEDVDNKYLTPYLEVNPELPATLLSVGEHDALKVETLAYARKLQDNDIKVKAILYRGMGHAYFDQAGNYPQSEDCVNEIIRFIEENK